jgi:HupE / UreJ protein
MSDFIMYLKMGWGHIMSWGALDHILFIAALAVIYTLTEWKQVLILVTAFTIGHSITLVLSVYDIIRFDSDWVEFLIPCTIVLTSLANLFQKEFNPRTIRINYFLALFFGLIHGMGFAGAIRFTLAGDQQIGWGLFSFNIGLEIGQIFVVLLILLVTQLVTRVLHVKRREWVIFLSAAVFSLSLKMALERIP